MAMDLTLPRELHERRSPWSHGLRSSGRRDVDVEDRASVGLGRRHAGGHDQCVDSIDLVGQNDQRSRSLRAIRQRRMVPFPLGPGASPGIADSILRTARCVSLSVGVSSGACQTAALDDEVLVANRTISEKTFENLSSSGCIPGLGRK